jgi:general secretion pathway protein K
MNRAHQLYQSHQSHQSHSSRLKHQRGVAVVTALLLTTLAVTIVASLFWQQQVQVRSIENQRMQLQKQWILRGALDWARLILRENHRNFPAVDDLTQPWAVGLAETRLDAYVDNSRTNGEATDATIVGKIVDAQSYFNLNNLSLNRKPVRQEIKAFKKLLSSLSLDPNLADAAALAIATSQPKTLKLPSSGAETSTEDSQVNVGEARTLELTQVEDLLAVPGFTLDVVKKLKNFVVLIQQPFKVNINTASAEVLAARIESLKLADARVLIASRNTASFNSVNELTNRLQGLQLTDGDKAALAVRSDFFIVDGKVKLNRAGLEVTALINRTPSVGGPVTPTVVWVKEN